jgi:hypothetical protein
MRSGAGDDQWGCRIGRAGSVVLALLAGALSWSGTFGTLPVRLRGLDGRGAGLGRRSARRSFEGSLEIQGHSKCDVNN